MLSLSFRFARHPLLFPTPKMYSISLVLSVPRGGCATKISWNLELTEIVCALTNDAGFQGPKEQRRYLFNIFVKEEVDMKRQSFIWQKDCIR